MLKGTSWIGNPVYVVDEATQGKVKKVEMHFGGDGGYFYYDFNHPHDIDRANYIKEEYCFTDVNEATQAARKMVEEKIHCLNNEIQRLKCLNLLLIEQI